MSLYVMICHNMLSYGIIVTNVGCVIATTTVVDSYLYTSFWLFFLLFIIFDDENNLKSDISFHPSHNPLKPPMCACLP